MKELDRQSELKNCNLIRAVLMLLVVLYHSIALFAGGWSPYTPSQESPVLGYIAEWLNSFHIYGFTLISGYVFYYIKCEKGGYQKYLPFLGNKAKRLLVPYAVIATVWVAPVYVYYYGAQHLVTNFVFGFSPNQLWFLLMLFWVFAIYWLLSNLANKKPIIGGLIVCACFCVGLFAPGFYRISTGMQYLLFFYIGFMIRKSDVIDRVLYKIPSWVYITIDILIFAVVGWTDGIDNIVIKILHFGFSILLNILGAVGAFVLLQRFVNRFCKDSKVLSFFSKNSMAVYLVHQQVIYFSIGWFNGLVPPVVLILLNFIIALGVSTVFAVLMSKTKVTRFLIGS